MQQSTLGIFEGAFASRVIAQNLEILAPYASAPGAWTAQDGGLLQGRFGFGDPATGIVSNAQQTAADALGVVIPYDSVNLANGGVVGGPRSFGGPQSSFTWQTFDRVARAWRLRAGLMVVLGVTGNFFLRFAGGANYGDTVYASPIDGTAISGAALGAVATPFKVCRQVSSGGLTIVSSTAFFNP